MLKLYIFNNSAKVLSKVAIRKIFIQTMQSIGISEENGYINLIFVSREKIKELNKTFRGKDLETDVLSFKYDDLCKGEIVISQEVVWFYAEIDKKNEKNMLKRVIIHGLLHLSDYDHIKLKDRKRMEKKEEEIFQKIK